MSDQKMPETLQDDALDGAVGAGHVPAHTPEFTDPSAGDPGRTSATGHELTHTIQQTGTGETSRKPGTLTATIKPQRTR